MNNIKGFVLGLMIGFILAITGSTFAQSATAQDPAKSTDSCCSMASCCCNGDSCAMNHKQGEHAKKDGCCSGDACAKKDGAKNHAEKDEGNCCGADCCKHDANKAGGHGESCCGDSCNMKMKHKEKKG